MTALHPGGARGKRFQLYGPWTASYANMVGINTRWSQHVQRGDHLWGQSVPQLEWELTVRRGERADEVRFKRLDGTFSCIDAMVVWLYEHGLAFFWGKITLDYRVCLIVHHVQFNLMTLRFQKFKLRFICGEDGDICEVGKGHCHYSVCFVVVYYQKANVAFKGHEAERTREVRI